MTNITSEITTVDSEPGAGAPTDGTASEAVEVDRTATPAELIRRAAGLRDQLRAQQDDAEARGHYGPDVHEALLGSGLYHLLTPKRYGGFELDMPSYMKVIVEVAKGDPSTAWCYCLAHGHNLTTASHWPVETQEEVFRNPAGYFRASHSVAGVGRAQPVDGGFVVNVSSPYQSGVPYSTYATVNVRRTDQEGEAAQTFSAIVPEGQFEVLDDWGGDTTLGQRASGSNTVVVTDTFVPDAYVVPFDWIFHDYLGHSVGTELHGNPMYLGPVAGFFHTEFASIMTGAAYAAVEEYEKIITTRTSRLPPYAPRAEDPLHLSDLGMALTMADAAQAIVIQSATRYMDYCDAAVNHGQPFTREMDNRLYGMAQRAAQMATDAVELLFHSAGSQAGKGGQPMQRYFRDISMYRGHASAQYRWTARRIAEMHLAARAEES